jgi:hypothetical protein
MFPFEMLHFNDIVVICMNMPCQCPPNIVLLNKGKKQKYMFGSARETEQLSLCCCFMRSMEIKPQAAYCTILRIFSGGLQYSMLNLAEN